MLMTFHQSKHFNPYYRDKTQKGLSTCLLTHKCRGETRINHLYLVLIHSQAASCKSPFLSIDLRIKGFYMYGYIYFSYFSKNLRIKIWIFYLIIEI